MILTARIPRRLRAPLAAALALALVLVSIGVGLRRDPFAFLFPFGRGPGLDYSAGPDGAFVPLDPGFVSDVLGEQIGGEPPRAGAGSSFGTREARFVRRPSVDPHPLTNDRMAEPRRVSSIPYIARTDASNATREPGEPRDCSGSGGTIWYRYTAGDEGALVATLSTGPSETPNQRVALGVFEEEEMRTVGCDENFYQRASVQFPTEPGTTYLFQIAGGKQIVFGLHPPPAMQLVSTNVDGEPGDNWSQVSRISGDGRIVVFESYANDIVPGSFDRDCWQRDPQDAGTARTAFGVAEGCPQILAHDRVTGETVLVSVSSDGELGNGGSRGPDISGNGRYVVFESWATNLIPGDTNRVADVFLHDLVTRRTERISVNTHGEQARGASFDAHSFMATISDDGRRVAFASTAPNLVEDDLPGTLEVFVRDRIAGTTGLVSAPLHPSDPTTKPERARDTAQTTEDTPILDEYMLPCISPDGRFVAFKSHAGDLIEGDTNGYADWFVRDLAAGVTERISVASDGTQGNGHAGVRSDHILHVRGNCFSTDNRYVVFDSEASNLVADDTNGASDGFMRDRVTGTTVRVTVDPVGAEFPRESYYTTISRDGRWVAFLGSDVWGSGLEPPGPSALRGVSRGLHIRNRRTGEVEWIPLVSGQRTGDGHWLDLSSDGRVVSLDTAFPVHTEDPDHPSFIIGGCEALDSIYDQVGQGCFEASTPQVYLIERLETQR